MVSSVHVIFKTMADILFCILQVTNMADKFTSPSFLPQFIDEYRKMPCLWKIKSKEYSNRVLKNDALGKLAELCKTIYPNADANYVRNKISNLRTVFKKELNKIKESERSGAGADDIYVPRLWYFDSLRFLTDQCDCRPSLSTLPSTSTSTESESPEGFGEDNEEIPLTQEPSLTQEFSGTMVSF